ncbi:MAG: sensor histidine kinase [Opitutales bacterium]
MYSIGSFRYAILGAVVFSLLVAFVLMASDIFFRKNLEAVEGLEARVNEIDERLESISKFTMRTGTGTVGYRSDLYHNDSTELSILIDWGERKNIDEVILVPVVHRGTGGNYYPNGFPIEYTITCGVEGEESEVLIANVGSESFDDERIAPVIFPVSKGMEASWLRIDTTKIGRRVNSIRNVLKIAEILVFSGDTNLALGADVTVDEESAPSFAWRKEYLVDGHMPFLMDSNQGDGGEEVISRQGAGDPPTLIVDLGEVYTIDRIHLHPVQVNDTVPRNYEPHFGIPKAMVVHGAKKRLFTPDDRLFVNHVRNPYQVGPIMGFSIEPRECRFIRFVAERPYHTPFARPSASRFGFVEIEIFSGDENVAKGKKVISNFDYAFNVKSGDGLTDGKNLYGSIIPIRQWVNELSERYSLEAELPEVLATLNSGYAGQRRWVAMLWVIVMVLALAVLVTIGSVELLRRRSVINTRKRISADLHDEFGANLHAIGLLSDIADSLAGKPEQQSEVLSQLKETTRKAGESSRYLTNMLEAEELYEDIVGDMKHVINKLFADLDAEISFSGSSSPNALVTRRRIDIFLFFQETLTNVFRHSGASVVRVEVFMDKKILEMTVTDNGIGTVREGIVSTPKSLKRRARYLRANLEVTQPEAGGTRVRLKLRLNKNDIKKVDT